MGVWSGVIGYIEEKEKREEKKGQGTGMGEETKEVCLSSK